MAILNLFDLFLIGIYYLLIKLKGEKILLCNGFLRNGAQCLSYRLELFRAFLKHSYLVHKTTEEFLLLLKLKLELQPSSKSVN